MWQTVSGGSGAQGEHISSPVSQHALRLCLMIMGCILSGCLVACDFAGTDTCTACCHFQDLSTQAVGAEREALVRHAIEKFRYSLRLRPDFDRGCYNLGWVYHAHAANLQKEALGGAKGMQLLGATTSCAPRVLCMVLPGKWLDGSMY
jgi:hypothetical protein